jgi:hypothetical protein
MVRRLLRPLGTTVLFFGIALASVGASFAATSITGAVYDAVRHPVADAVLTLTGDNVKLTATSDVRGRFGFPGLEAGAYRIEAHAPAGVAYAQVELSSGGANLSLTLLRTVAFVATSTLPPLHGSGTDVTLNESYLARSPSAQDFPSLLLQLPGAARGANGVVHINGDHGDLDYVVDGVPIPQELNREIGSEFDPSDVSFIEVLEGAYPAQYGNRFAGVVNVATRAGQGPPGFSGYTSAGSYGFTDTSLGYHGTLAGGSFVANLRAERSDWFPDPPNPDSPHNEGSNVNDFFRYTKSHGNDYWNFALSRSYQTFQIPNDVAGGEPPSTDDNETQNDLFGALELHHALRQGGSVAYGLGYKRSQIRDFPDLENDLTYGEHLNFAAGGSPVGCAKGVVSACAYSLLADRTSRDVTFNLDVEVPSARHDVKYGGAYDIATVQKRYAVTLQPGNFLAPIYHPANPGAAYTVVDNAPNVAHDGWVYLQDSWKMGVYRLDYGVRSDGFQVFSTQFDRGFAQVSPRVKLTRFLGARANVYVYYGRFFTPFSLENVSPEAAYLLNLPLQKTPARYDLLPQRDSEYEIGGHLPLAAGQLGLRVMQKNATDLIDDTQVGVTALHQDINYAQGRISQQSAYYQQPLDDGGRFYISFTHSRSVNKGCETQLLAPCFGQPSGWTPADHDQTWDASGGFLRNDRRGGWLALSGEYGGGLSSALCSSTILFCKVPPHTTFDVEKGTRAAPGTAIVVTIQNVLNDRYRVTFLNAQGNHYAMPRTIHVGVEFGR